MSVFASQTKSEPIPIPFDPPHTIVVRALTGRELDFAEAEDLRGFVGGRSPRGWAKVFADRLANGTATDADAERTLTDPLNGFDRHALVSFGLMSYSGVGESLTDEQKRDFTDEMVEFCAREVMKRTKPERFQTVEEMQAARKNGPGPSTSS